MAFSLSGSTITQTGTDTDLSGLSGITGVTSLQVGSGVDLATTYKIDGLRLQVNGTLSLGVGQIEILAFEDNVPDNTLNVGGSGELTIGEIIQDSGATRSTHPQSGIYFAKRYGRHWTGNAVDNSGTINWYGLISGRTAPLRTNAGGVWNIQGATWQAREVCSSFNVQSLFFHQEGEVNINGFKLVGRVSFNRVVNGVVNSFNDVQTINSGGIGQNQNSQSPFVLEGYNPKGNVIDLGFWAGQSQVRGIISNNSPVGVNQILGGIDASGATIGWIETRQDLILDYKDLSGTSINNVAYYFTDTDNGNRGAVISNNPNNRNLNYLGTDGLTYGADRIYSGVANGQSANISVLTSVLAAEGSGLVRVGYDTGSQRIDRRTLSDVQGSFENPSDFNINSVSYNHLILQVAQNIVNDEALTLPLTLFSDTLITEQDKTITDAYTEIETLDKLYDRAKSWKVDSANVEVPTISTLLFTANGMELVMPTDYDLVIDYTATDVIAVNSITKVITIKASALGVGTKFTTLKSQGTGTISVANSETINVGFIDANGDSFLKFVGIDSWEVFSDSARTTSLATGTGNYRFNFSSGTSYYLDLVVSGETIQKTVTPSASGETEVSLSTAGLLTALQSQVNGLNDISESEVNAQVDQALSDYDAPTKAEMDAKIDSLNNTSAAQVVSAMQVVSADFKDKNTSTEIHSALDSYSNKNDYKANNVNLGTMPTEVSAIKAKTDLLNFVGDDVKSTLDGEEVITDSSSRNASKQDKMSQSEFDTLMTNTSQAIKDDYKSNNVDLSSVLTAINNLNDISASDVSVQVANNLSSGITLTTAQVNAIAVAIESAIINEGDGNQVIAAMVNAIGNTNLTTGAIATAVRTELANELARIDENISDVREVNVKQINGTNVSSVEDLKASTVSVDLGSLPTNVSAIKTKTDQLNFTSNKVNSTLNGEEVTTDAASRNASKSDVSNIIQSIDALNDISETDVRNQVDGSLSDYDGPTKAELDSSQSAIISAMPTPTKMSAAELHQALNDYANKNDWKADVSGLSTSTDISNLNNVSVSEISTAISSLLSSGISLTSAERTAIAEAIETTLMDENDGRAFVSQIVTAVTNASPTVSNIAAAVWGDTSTYGSGKGKDLKTTKDNAVSAASNTRHV